MGSGLVGGGENTGRLNNVLGASLLPGDVGGVTLLVELDGLAVHDEVVTLDGDGAIEDAVAGVIPRACTPGKRKEPIGQPTSRSQMFEWAKGGGGAKKPKEG